jgi:endoglucanase
MAATAASGWAAPWAAAQAAPSSVPAKLPQLPQPPQLHKGVNLTHWFEYERSQAVSGPEMQALRAAGLDHVRIPLDPVVGGWDVQKGGRLTFIAELQDSVALALQAGLEVVVDLHLEPATKQHIEDHPASETNLVQLWTQLARALAHTPPERVALELFNEPQYYGLKRWRWPALQKQLLAAVRAVAPQHLVLLSSHAGGSFEGLQGLATVDDKRVAYVFHHYEPFLFTHQGAQWLDTRYTTAGLHRGLRYPPQAQHGPASDTHRTLQRPHPRAAKELADYLTSGWGAQRMHTEFGRVAAWAQARGVRVLCNEFGVIREHVDAASRYRWISDVRSALQAHGIGWTLWDYGDIFGITVGAGAQSTKVGRYAARTLEPDALQALGLVAVGAAQGAAR